MLQPKRTKFRKVQRGKNRGVKVGQEVSFGSYGLKAITRGFISSQQIEAARRVITRTLKRQGQLWIRMFPDKPMTKKPLEVRMGKGKGPVESWVSVIAPGKVLYEVDGISEEMAKDALRLASAKLPVKTTFIKKMVF